MTQDNPYFNMYSPELLNAFKQDMEKGQDYHNLLNNFLSEHPEVVDEIIKEHEYFPFIIVKLRHECPELSYFLSMSEPVKETLKSLFDVLLLQGYYRCYQKMTLERMK